MSLIELDRADKGAAAKHKYVIVDADAHIDPPHEMWADYLPERFRDMAPRVEEGEECDWLIFEGNRRPIMMINNQAGRKGKDFKMVGKQSEMRDVKNPHSRLADMDLDGVDAAILFGGGPLGTKNSDLYIESFRAYFRWLKDFCATDPRRLHGVAYMPMRDIDETMGLIREAAGMGFRTVNIPAFPQSKDGMSTSVDVGKIAMGQAAALTGDPGSQTPYWDASYDKLWALICELDLTVTFHLGGRIPRFGQKIISSPTWS